MYQTIINGIEFTEQGLISDLHNCPRCGERHKRILVVKFKSKKVTVESKVFKCYAICPITNEPILITDVNTSLMAC